MAEETQQEKEARWQAHRVSQAAEQKTFQAERSRARTRKGMVGVIVIVVVGIVAAIMLF